MNPDIFISQKAAGAVKALYNAVPDSKLLQPQATKKEFEGDLTLVTFPLLRVSKKSPEATAEEIGNWLKTNCPEIKSYNVVKGFLNLKFSDEFWLKEFAEIYGAKDFGQLPPTGKTVMVEFSSPNTNKPLHLGHIRNNLLGWSVSKLMEANGNKVVKTNIVNDRGIHICKSMIAWKREANGATPSSTGIKGDHFVGNYYVAFNNILKKQAEEILAKGTPCSDPDKEKERQKEAEREAPIQHEAQAMLRKWEAGDKEVVDLWRTMNGWVYKGFDETYKRMGISFDIIYYESDTYKLGKKLVMGGLEKGIFEKHPDGSVWCNLEKDGLDQKLLLRGDGTSVYMTQDLGTAEERFDKYHFDQMIYVVGDEQNYHFQVLKLILKKLGFGWADSIYHMSYGMVELPEGKMKSREGTVVDADDLIDEMFNTAKENSQELGKLEGLSKEEQNKLFEMLGLGALKYFIIKVDPRKTMLFNPKESIDFNGNTGPFIQYTHARIKSILRKAEEMQYAPDIKAESLLPKEIELIKLLNSFPEKIKEAGDQKSPAVVANYCYDLAKEFNQYYHDYSILKEENQSVRAERLAIASVIAKVLVKGMGILGIELPERM
ncbi:MAG: arginine--tRNA ligase [Bacteroidales bacterium]|jgi:arginyl-tRNA synthetase|nr:arginine--tRNA ligase [Bacteroidales bacterium]MCI1733569.1 arginine--tRNA ligase [Bacteroidales bacterium]